jgi:histidyl-tRNA synthetase
MYYLNAPIFRYEKPQSGRLREHHQFGMECFGAREATADAELILTAYHLLQDLGIGNLSVEINSIGCPNCRPVYHARLKEYLSGRMNKLCATCRERFDRNPLRVLDCKEKQCQELTKDAPSMLDLLCDQCRAHFEELKACLDGAGIPYRVNPRIVRGLDYYTDTVFEVENITGKAGAQATVFAGGRYDGLVSYFGGPEVSGFGFAMGMERLILLAEDEGVKLDEKPKTDVYVMSLGNVGTKPLELATEARALGYITDFNYAPRSLKAQFKTVDRLDAKITVIAGESELAEGKVNIKNNRTKEQVTVSLEDYADTLDEMMEDILNETDSL